VTIDGQSVPVIMARSLPLSLSPPILSGHGLNSDRQIVLGAGTLAVLHKQVGGTVLLSYQNRQDAPNYIPPTPLRIVGTATFPAVGYESLVADHTSMGTGALFSEGIFPLAFQQAIHCGDPNAVGPAIAFVRLKAGVSTSAGRVDMQRIAHAADEVFAADPNTEGQIVTVLGVQRPAQIVNYRSIGSTPVILAAGLALGAIVALGLSLVVSVRRRRHDLALLKALGFTPRQLTAAVAWQATVASAIGIIVGIPTGIVIGRELWTLFARNLNAVPDPTVPVISIILGGIGALVFSNLVAAVPGRDAANTPTASLLRVE
jgi:FtsX-like permease family